MTRISRDDVLLVVLTMAAAATDAGSYLGLHQVFPANMTGNTVLLAIKGASGDYVSAGRSLLALAGFVVGAGLASVVGDPARPSMASRRFRTALAFELVALVGAAVWWLVRGKSPAGASQLGLIALFGTAMGIQSGAVTQLDVGVSTTFITGTWTRLAGSMRTRLRGDAGAARGSRFGGNRVGLQSAVLAAYFLSALATGYLFRAAGAAVAVLPCIATFAVCLSCRAFARTPTRRGA
jgi:uncharacterized membrane protein YoaK (UPF0700 family)